MVAATGAIRSRGCRPAPLRGGRPDPLLREADAGSRIRLRHRGKAVGFAMALAVLWHFVTGGGVYAPEGIDWFQIGPLHVVIGQYVDGLTAVMLVVVTAVSLAVHVYSLGYMHGDGSAWFYVVLSLFTGAMLTVVIANNLIMLLVGWEMHGVCSYLLIGHWYEEHENSSAAIKAFITTRSATSRSCSGSSR